MKKAIGYALASGVILGLSGAFVMGAAEVPVESTEPVVTEQVQSYTVPTTAPVTPTEEPVAIEDDTLPDDPETVVREDYLTDAPEFACPDGWTLAEDLSCVGPDFYEEVNEEDVQEDDPNWDCRFNGNQMCGVEIMGVWYVIQFEDGSPLSVTLRD
jgi:hypothetical protein